MRVDKDPVMALYNEKDNSICDYRDGVDHRFQLYLLLGTNDGKDCRLSLRNKTDSRHTDFPGMAEFRE